MMGRTINDLLSNAVRVNGGNVWQPLRISITDLSSVFIQHCNEVMEQLDIIN